MASSLASASTTSSAGGTTITGGAGNDGLLGTSGNDTMDGGGGSDALNGGAGNDTLIYRLGANAGAWDIYAGGSGIDTLSLQLTQDEWRDAGVRAQLERYVSFLSTANLNSKGELGSGGANNFVFSFPNGATLTVQMMEKLAVSVQNSSGEYVLIDPLASLITGPVTGDVTEAGGAGNAIPGMPTATGDLYAADLNGPEDAFQPVTSEATTYGNYALTSTGVWTYTLNNSNDAVQALNDGGSLTDHFTVRAQDGTIQVITINIAGSNDAAVISGTSMGDVTESGVADGGVSSVSGVLSFSDVDDAGTTFYPLGVPPTGSGMASSPGIGDEGYGTYTLTEQGLWTYTANNGNSSVQALNVGDTLADTFTVYTPDGTSQVVTVWIHGTDDAAVITDASVIDGSVEESGGVDNAAAGTPVATGTLLATDVDNPGVVAFHADLGATTYGSYEITAAGLWTYSLDDTADEVQALNVGDTRTDTFIASTQDGVGQVVTITIHGANDAAVISGTSTGQVAESGAADGGVPSVSGFLSFSDVDDAGTTFYPIGVPPTGSGMASPPAISDKGYGTYTLTEQGLWTYTVNNDDSSVQALNVGDTLADTFTVYTPDGTPQVVTITLHGANDAAVIMGAATGSVTEAGAAGVPGQPTASGTLTSTDVDNTDDAFQAAAGTATYGSFTMATNGEWTYTLDNENAALATLDSGYSLTDSFDLKSEDGTVQSVSITINGTTDAVNHAPTDITLTPDYYVVEPTTIIGTLSTTDADAGDSHTYSIVSTGENGDPAGFRIVGNDVEATGTTPGGSYTLNIGVTDAAGSTFSKVFKVFLGTGGPDEFQPLDEEINIFSFGGGGADSLNGGSQDDWLFGQSGDDSLSAGKGNDWIVGGTGQDTLHGGDGSDMFVFNAAMDSSNVDRIGDFTGGFDKIVLENGIFNALGTGAVEAVAFVTLSPESAVTATTRLIYDKANGELKYDADGSGVVEAVLIAVMGSPVVGYASLSSTDFIVI